MLLNKIKLQANHLASINHFYKEVMGLPVLLSDENTLKIGVGNTTLVFEKNDRIVDPYYHIAFNIPPNKFVEAFKWFQSRLSLLWVDEDQSFVADFINWNAKSFYFYDPAGNILEIIARFDLDIISDENFSGALICNICELGIVFPALDFDYYVDRFMNKYGLVFFDSQPPGPNFKVAGDMEGLFIIVPEGREWFPGTGKNSVFFPVSVSFETKHGQFEWTSKNEQHLK